MLTGVVVAVVFVAGVFFTLLIAVKSIRGAQRKLQVSPAQKQLVIKRWYHVRSRRRSNHVRSQLLAPKPGLPGADEEYLWVTGLAPARLWFMMIPALLGVVAAIALWIASGWFMQHPHTINISVRGATETFNLHRLYSLLCNIGAWITLIMSLYGGLFAYLQWSGEYLALSNYRLIHIHIHPAFVFWMNRLSDKTKTIELSDISSAGVRRSRYFGNAFNYATIHVDTPGEGDDDVFNDIPFIPNGLQRAREIDDLQRVAITPRDLSETDRVVESVNRLGDRLAGILAPQGHAERGLSPRPRTATAGSDSGSASTAQSETPPEPEDSTEAPAGR